MKPPTASPPRVLGLREPDGSHGVRHGHPPAGEFPYAVGARIAGDLTILGHLAVGRLCHLYQVWSAGEWCAFTCKILAPARHGRRADVAALRREARVLSGLRHPNLVRGYGGGEHDGLPYLLLEYLEGPSLFDLIEARPGRKLEPADAVRLAIHTGAALYHLHRGGTLHLDLKPANLLLRDGVPVLVDLDAARRIGGPPSRKRLGTPPYMPPEQAARLPLGPAADVYGLGALLYELLTGRWPFEHVYQNRSLSAEARQFPQLDGARPPALRRFAPGITDTLERIVLRCLEPEPRDRFEGMHPLLLALQDELGAADSLWPDGVRAERRRAPRPT